MDCFHVSFHAVAFGQRVITELALSDAPVNERGFIIATINNPVRTGAVCGQVDIVTAWLTCIRQGWIGVTGTSTVSGLG